MIRLNASNVLLKPTHRRQLLSRLRRSLRLGNRLGDFDLQIDLQRIRRHYVMHARVHDAAGDFACKSRGVDLRGVQRDLVSTLSTRLHDQCVQRRRVA